MNDGRSEQAADLTQCPERRKLEAMLRRWPDRRFVPGDARVDCPGNLDIRSPARASTSSSSDGPSDRCRGLAGELITDLRKEKDLVGLAAMVTVDGKVEAAAADGERKIGSGVPLRSAIAGIWEGSPSQSRPR